MASDQTILRILTVAPTPDAPRAPSLIEQGIVPTGGGGGIAPGVLTPEQIGELQAQLYDPPAEREPYTPIPLCARAKVMRGRLLGMAGRNGATSMILAGQLLRDHGDDARRQLRAAWLPSWPVRRDRIDALLEAAGVPVQGDLEGGRHGSVPCAAAWLPEQARACKGAP